MDALLGHVKTNIVQSIRAHRVTELQQAAKRLGHHFLYAKLSQASSKQDVLDIITQSFMLAPHSNRNFDTLYAGMTDPLHKSGPQPGFILVLEHLPSHAKFDKEVREQLLDVFREVSEYWSERRVSFRCFYSFSVARARVTADDRSQTSGNPEIDECQMEQMPTDKLVDISPMALRMSSPFNADYWAVTN